jgi:peptidoglycan/LPS O-acetylase OafA/YrhL
MRGVFLAAPIIVHLGLAGSGNGLWLAIGLFFTLSGFLITSLALAEIERSGRLHLRAFWARRFRRLIPASTLVLASIVGAAWWLGWPVMDRVGGDVRASLVWWNNWHQLGADGYWGGFTPSLTAHFWSLSIEEQVYLVMPLLVAGAVLAGRWVRPVFTVMATAAIVLALSWTVLLTVDDPTYLYLSTWTRMGEVAAGAFAAAVVAWRPPARLADRTVNLVAAALLLVEVPVWILARADTATGIRLGIVGSTPAVTLLVALVWTNPRSVPARLFSLGPVSWLGRRSYGVYLLHVPVFDLFAFRLGVQHVRGVWMAVALVGTVALAALMFRFVEEPIRIAEMLPQARAFASAVGSSAAAVVTLSIVAASLGPVTFRPPGETTGPPPPTRPALNTLPPSTAPGGSTPATTTVAPSTVPGGGPTTVPPPPATAGGSLLVVGDSTAWVTSGAVRGAADPLGFVTDGVNMAGCPFGGDVRLKTSYGGGRVVIREMGEEPGCDEWFDEILPAWLSDRRPTLVMVVGGYALAYEVDPGADGRWCRLGDGTGRCESWAAGRLAATTERIRAYAPEAHVVWTTAGHVDPWGPLDIPPDAIDVLNRLIDAEARRSGASVLDLGTWLDGHLDLTVDGTHLGPEGVAALTPWMATEIPAVLARQRLLAPPAA